MTRIHRLALAGFTTLGVLATSVAPAGAATGYANLCPVLKTAFCTAGTLHARGVAVDNSSGASAGDIWVASNDGLGADTLVKFDASGNQLAEVTNRDIPGSAEPLREINDIAVDPTSGDVYVSDYKGTVTKFSSSGVFQSQITESDLPNGLHLNPVGLAVDGSSGYLYVGNGTTNSPDAIYVFASSGVYVERLEVPIPLSAYYLHFAVDSHGNLYVETSNGILFTGTEVFSRVSEYNSAGAPVNCPNGNNVLYEDPEVPGYRPSVAVAVDSSSDHLFIGEFNGGEGFVVEYSAACATPQAILGAGEFKGRAPVTLGVSNSTGKVYAIAANREGEVGLIFSQVTVPDVTTASQVTGVTRKTAQVSGIVNPDETAVTTCEFEYGASTAYGQSVPCSLALPLEGKAPIAVSGELTFSLPPATTVHYRLKAGNVDGSNYGADQTFSSEPLPPPIVGGLLASNVSQLAATFNGALKTGEAAVDYRFEYGTTTDYGQLAPIPDSYAPITSETFTVSQPVNGLQPGTTYHYRLVASSPGATDVKGPDESFTTLPVPPPVLATGGASGVGVGTATLSGSIDPHGWDTSYEFQYGTSAAYGSSWPTVPVELGAFEDAQGVVVSVSNLLPGTTYHYRLMASNAGGASYGQDMTFTTGEYPAAIIQEPPALRTLLVPTGKVAKPMSGKARKKAGKGRQKKRGKKSRRRPRAKHSRRQGGAGRRG
jgi:hypothetical protein